MGILMAMYGQIRLTLLLIISSKRAAMMLPYSAIKTREKAIQALQEKGKKKSMRSLQEISSRMKNGTL